MTQKGLTIVFFYRGLIMNLTHRYQVKQVKKLECVKGIVGNVYNVALSDYPKKGDSTLVTGLPESVFLCLSGLLFEPTTWFSFTQGEAKKKTGDDFYIAFFMGRFEVYPFLVESVNPVPPVSPTDG